jgi:spore coat protein U-like protein
MFTKTRSKSPAVGTAIACAMLLASMAHSAFAQSSATLSIPVQAAVGPVTVSLNAAQNALAGPTDLNGCAVSSSAINFGAVNTPSLKSKTSARSVEGSLTIVCGPSAPQLGSFSIQVGVDNGMNASAVGGIHLPSTATATRAVSHGKSSIAYDVYKPVVAAGLFFNGTAPTPAASMTRYEWGDVANQAVDNQTCDIPGSQPLGSLFCLLDESGDGLAFTLPSTLLSIPYSPDPGSGMMTIPIVATIPGGQFQNLPPGVYTDTITVTLTFF